MSKKFQARSDKGELFAVDQLATYKIELEITTTGNAQSWLEFADRFHDAESALEAIAAIRSEDMDMAETRFRVMRLQCGVWGFVTLAEGV